MYHDAPPNLRLCQAGTSLVSVIVAVGIMGIFTTLMNKQFVNQVRAKTSIELDYDLMAAKRTILSKVSCELSYDENTCPNRGPLPLFDKKGEVFISDSGKGTQLGKWTFRAECNPKMMDSY